MENSMSPELKTKIQVLFNSLNQGLVERESILKMALLTVLAGENLLLIGPPGTAKSLIARRIAQTLTADDNSSDYFEYLLTKFSTPEEIFGPLSIAALKADCVKRNTTGYLPTVRIAFLDEIFKASSSILNALLTILNERKYHNGAEVQDVPMQALIAASNELPTGQEELSALYDRFLVRVFVDYVSLDGLPQLFEKTPEIATVTPFTIEELDAIKQAANEVSIPPEIVQAIQQIWQKHRETFKEDRREQLSDRRLKKVIKLVSVAAVTNGRTEVDLSDVFLLKDCLWNHPDNAMKVLELIRGEIVPSEQNTPITNIKVYTIKAPVFPESVAGGMVATWHKRVGEAVSRDEVICDIETDKVVLEVVAPADGIISKIIKEEGDTVLSAEIIAEFVTDIADMKAILAGLVATKLDNNKTSLMPQQISANIWL